MWDSQTCFHYTSSSVSKKLQELQSTTVKITQVRNTCWIWYYSVANAGLKLARRISTSFISRPISLDYSSFSYFMPESIPSCWYFDKWSLQESFYLLFSCCYTLLWHLLLFFFFPSVMSAGCHLHQHTFNMN